MYTHIKSTLPILLAGIMSCLYFALKGTAVHCITTGCALYSGLSFLGITFYMWGFVFFTCAMGAFFYKKAPNLYGYLIIGALIADMAFLTYQLLLWPCLNCLLVAAIIGALGITVEFTDSVKKKAQMWLRGALLLWGLVFFSVSINAAKEIVLQPWALLSPANEIAIVYFSPTCPSCEQTVMNLLNSPDAARVRLIPVAKNDTDARRLAALPEHPTVANIKNMFRSDASTAEMTLIDRLNMMRNKASMASKGISQVPTIISNTIVASQSTFSFPEMFTSTIEKKVDSCSMVFEDPACTFPSEKHSR